MSNTTDIFSKCVPAIRTNVKTCGLMTVCDATVPKPSELDDIYKDGSSYRVMEALFMHDLEMKACQAREYGLYDFFVANAVDMSHKIVSEAVQTGVSKIRPYILVQREGPINNNYWIAESGTSAGGGRWQIDVYSPTGIPNDATWFNTKEVIYIKGETDAGTSTDTAWKVYTSTIVGNRIRLVLDSQNLGSYLSGSRLESPTKGLVVRGVANVNEFESFCSRPPGLITSTEDEFWIQQTRDVQCTDELYEEWLELVKNNNPLYAKYFDLPTVKYNAQTGLDFKKRFVETLMRNKPLENQSIHTVDSLENISTTQPGGGKCIGKRANAVGYYEQHARCGRVIDLQGAQFNIPALAEALYQMSRLRHDLGMKTDKVFEAMTDTVTAYKFNLAFLDYQDALSRGKITYTIDPTQQQKTSPMGWMYNEYKLMWPAGVSIRIMSDFYFDDYLSNTQKAGLTNAGRQFWIIDWSGIYPGIIKTERVVNKTGDKDVLTSADPASYACVPKFKTTTYTFTLIEFTAIVECPQANLIFENFSDDIPEARAQNNISYINTTTTTTTTTGA
jgi:hypothetical protein